MNMLSNIFFILNLYAISFSQSIHSLVQNGTNEITSKTIIVCVVSNITNEKIANVQILAHYKNKKCNYLTATVIKNYIDHINWIRKTETSIVDDLLELRIYANSETDSVSKKDKNKWIGENTGTIYFSLTDNGNLKSLTPNKDTSETNLRFGGKFLDQSKGIFITQTVSLR